jgi:hypothetical protein
MHRLSFVANVRILLVLLVEGAVVLGLWRKLFDGGSD